MAFRNDTLVSILLPIRNNEMIMYLVWFDEDFEAPGYGNFTFLKSMWGVNFPKVCTSKTLCTNFEAFLSIHKKMAAFFLSELF